MNEVWNHTTICKRMYREEAWIDWLLGRFAEDGKQEMEQHLTQCEKCRRIVAEWGPLLQQGGESRYMPEEDTMPSRSIYRRLRSQVRVRSVAHAIRRRGKRIAAAAAALVLIVSGFAVYQTAIERSSDQRSVYVAQYEPNAVSFMNDPKTASYRIHPYNDALGEGYVWYNGVSKEMLVMLEGLFPSEGHVVQAWAVDGTGRANLGLLRKFEASREHLYFKGEQLASANHIVLTVEPVGGSDYPTTPDAFVFELLHK